MRDLTFAWSSSFKREKLKEHEIIRAARASGTPLRDLNGQARRPLSNKSINKLLELLARITRRCELAHPLDGVEEIPSERAEDGCSDRQRALVEVEVRRVMA